METTETKPIRELMPKGFLPILARESGATRPNCSNAVNDENIKSKKIWPAIERLALETNPEAARLRIAYLKAKHNII